MRYGSFGSNLVFEREVISHSYNKRLWASSVLLGIWKHTQQGRVFFSFNFSIIFKFSQFCNVGIQQVRILVFDNITKNFQWDLSAHKGSIQTYKEDISNSRLFKTFFGRSNFNTYLISYQWAFQTKAPLPSL